MEILSRSLSTSSGRPAWFFSKVSFQLPYLEDFLVFLPRNYLRVSVIEILSCTSAYSTRRELIKLGYKYRNTPGGKSIINPMETIKILGKYSYTEDSKTCGSIVSLHISVVSLHGSMVILHSCKVALWDPAFLLIRIWIMISIRCGSGSGFRQCCGSGSESGSTCFWTSWILLSPSKKSKKNLIPTAL